jgi:ketosteroid isomerase-like protein
MSEKENVQVVQKMYAAFAQKYIPAVLDTLSDDVDWQSPVTRTQPDEISWSKPRKGREEVGLFFKEMAEKVEPERLEPLEITAQGDRVVVEGKNRGIVRSTGKPYEHDWVMIFTIRQGKITTFRHYYDSIDIRLAFRTQ